MNPNPMGETTLTMPTSTPTAHADQLRIALSQLDAIEKDRVEAGSTISMMLTNGIDAHGIRLAVGFVKDMQASVLEITHSLLSVVFDTWLRDHPTIIDQHGNQFQYRGMESSGFRFGTVSGEFGFHLKIHDIEPGGNIIASKNSGPIEIFRVPNGPPSF